MRWSFVPKTPNFLNHLEPIVARVLDQVRTERELAESRALARANDERRREHEHEIAQRKRVEQALREAEENLRRMFESLKDVAIFTVDTHGRVASWNPGAEHLFGYDEPEVLGQGLAIIFTPAPQGRVPGHARPRAQESPGPDRDRGRDPQAARQGRPGAPEGAGHDRAPDREPEAPGRRPARRLADHVGQDHAQPRADAAAVVARAVEISRPLIDARRHGLVVSLPHRPLRLEADATRIAQAPRNSRTTPRATPTRVATSRSPPRARATRSCSASATTASGFPRPC